MESVSNTKLQAQIMRQLSSLKIVSRLLAHELHAQASSKSVTLSRDEVGEIQTCIDLFIEEVSRRQGAQAGAPPIPMASAGSRAPALGAPEPTLVTARTN
jgi:hypothetical protein